MTKLYYRAMAAQNGKPKIGKSARLLGVRLNVDITIEYLPLYHLDEQGYLLSEIIERQLQPVLVPVAIRDMKGMSVSLSIEALPAFRKPPKFDGMGKDSLWQIDDSKITGDLEAIQDSQTHVSIRPRATMLLERYESALAQTQDHWEKID